MDAVTTKPKAYSYVRFSTPDQAAGDSLRRQTEAARRYASQHSLDLDEGLSFRDLGVSAHHGRNAEVGALGAFLVAVRDGQVPQGSYLLIESLDRISRQVVRKAVRTLEDITEAGIIVVDLSDGGRAYSPDMLDRDQFAYVMMALRFIRANEESATKGMRVGAAYDRKRARAAARERLAAPFTRMLPAWLRWNDDKGAHELIPDRAKIVRQIFENTDRGRGQHAIAHELNRAGVKLWGRGKHWHRSYVRKILTNPAAVGTFVPHKAEKGAGGVRRRKPLEPIINFWPAAVPKELFDRVTSRFTAPAARGRHANRAPLSIFAGVLRCHRCGSAVVRSSKGEHVYLVCAAAHARAGCVYQAVRYGDVEVALTRDATTIIHAAPRGADTEEIEAEIQNLDNALWEMSQDASALVDELAVTRSAAVRQKLAHLEAQLEAGRERARKLASERESKSGPYVAKRLARLKAGLLAKPIDVAKANRALKESVDQIVMDPEQGELAIRWKHAPQAQCIGFVSRHAPRSRPGDEFEAE